MIIQLQLWPKCCKPWMNGGRPVEKPFTCTSFVEIAEVVCWSLNILNVLLQKGCRTSELEYSTYQQNCRTSEFEYSTYQQNCRTSEFEYSIYQQNCRTSEFEYRIYQQNCRTSVLEYSILYQQNCWTSVLEYSIYQQTACQWKERGFLCRILTFKGPQNINPFTAPARKITGLKDARTRLQTLSIFSGPMTHLFSMLWV